MVIMVVNNCFKSIFCAFLCDIILWCEFHSVLHEAQVHPI